MKKCSKCHINKDISQFYKGKNYRDGYNGWCKSCMANYQRSRRFMPASIVSKVCGRCKNLLPISDFSTNRCMRDGFQFSCKPCRRIESPYNRKRYQKHYKDHSDEYKLRAKQRIALKQGLIAHYSLIEWTELKERFYDRCVLCLIKCEPHVDHIIPLSRGGMDTIDNIQPMCKHCNSSKWITAIDYRPFFHIRINGSQQIVRQKSRLDRYSLRCHKSQS